jgi:beta-lactamase regulating signal transducer with metallopeptidase domain/protocatechuate 3,4-dioxygenase beta subunit
MATVLNTVADYLVRQSWQLPVIFALVLAGSWGLRKASAHWRYLLWLVVIAKCLTPPMLTLPLALLPRVIESEPEGSVANVSAPPRVSETIASVGDSHASSSPTLVQQASGVASPSVRASSSEGSNHFDLRQWLVMAWILVVGVILMYVSGKAWTTHRRLQQARLPVDKEIRNVVDSLAKGLGMSRAPTVYMAAPIAQPFVWGWLRGDIYFPLQFAKTVSAEQQRAILTHELAHVARWDAAVNHLQIIVQAIFFFHPLIWWTNKKIRQEREKCCDEIVLAGLGTRPQLYCEAIVDMLTLEFQAQHASPGLAVTGSTRNIEERIVTILTPDRKFCRRPSWAAIVTLLLVAACVLPTAFILTTRAAAPDTKAPSNSTWQKGQVIDVRVINAQTKDPIPGVKLELQNQGPGINFQDIKVHTTDADGRSQVTLPDLPPTAVRIYPTKAGLVPLRVYWEGEPTPVMPKSVTIPMERAKAFGGTIRNEAGEPIPNVAININYWAKGAGENPHLRANIDAKATSDKDGRWQVNVMPAKIEKDLLRIFLTHPDYISDHLSRIITPIPVTEQPPIEKLFDQTAVMIMRKGGTIQGRVTDKDGKPIRNAAIHESEYYWFGSKKPRAQTDGEGNFRIAGIKPVTAAPNTWRSLKGVDNAAILTVQAAGYAPELIDVPHADAPLKVRLEPGHTVRGRVVDEDGKAVQGVTIEAVKWRNQLNRLHLEAKSDADGNFHLSDVPADDVIYSINKDGYIWTSSFSMSPSANEYLIPMKPTVRIVGSVVDAETGKPLEKFSLIQGMDYGDGRPPAWRRPQAKSITSGKYTTTLEQEKVGYLVRVEAKGYMPEESRVFRAYDPDKGEISNDFKLHKAASLSGTVLGLDGKPLPDAEVYLATNEMQIFNRKVTYNRDNPKVKTNEAGEFKFAAEVEPFCLVAVHAQGIAMITEKEFRSSVPLSIQPWTEGNQILRIIRRPAAGQDADFPKKSP